MKAGFAERDITPEAGMERPGGYGKAYHDGNVHDPCKVRVGVFDDGIDKVVLIGVDTLAVPRSFVLNVRKRAYETCGINPDAVMIGASHSHSAGPLGMIVPGYFNYASDMVKHLAYEKSSNANPEYIQQVEDATVEAITEADKSRITAKCGTGAGHENKACFNRRFRMKDGITCTHPGKCNPDIIEPAGPIDPEVGVVGAWDSEDNLLGCVVNYACHGTTGPGGTSADWIYYLEKTIRGVMGDNAIVVFLNGACGDVTQVDNQDPYSVDFGERSARYVGTRVGAEAVKVLVSIEPGKLKPIKFLTNIIPIKRRIPSEEKLTKALDIVQKTPSDVGATEWTFAKETVLLKAVIEKKTFADVEIQAIQIGPAVFLANPAEFFCQYGLDLKNGSQFPFTFPVELANGCIGYVPTEEAMGEHGGGYETRLTSYSNLEVRAGHMIVEGLIDLTRQLTPGEVPMPSKSPVRKERWTYGNVKPEIT
ncbi:hypothetical protein GF312_03360 [Candidatus Poribacteria bacterium]|nr:hypothetical protein [Candidatus Poribacteria bacterium]